MKSVPQKPREKCTAATRSSIILLQCQTPSRFWSSCRNYILIMFPLTCRLDNRMYWVNAAIKLKFMHKCNFINHMVIVNIAKKLYECTFCFKGTVSVILKWQSIQRCQWPIHNCTIETFSEKPQIKINSLRKQKHRYIIYTLFEKFEKRCLKSLTTKTLNL